MMAHNESNSNRVNCSPFAFIELQLRTAKSLRFGEDGGALGG